jgi:hypothetical protein
MNTEQATNVVQFKQADALPAPSCATAQCVKLAMANALGEFRHSVTGTVVHGRAFLRGSVKAPQHKDWIEQSVRRLACVVDVVNDVAVERSSPLPRDRKTRRVVNRKNQPLLYVSDYCSLEQHALEVLIGRSMALLVRELGDAATPVTDVIVFYYLWHEGVAMVDIALPSAMTLERRPNGSVRGTILPEVSRWTRPKGGIAGLSAARNRLARRCGADPGDPFFRVWQRISLSKGTLPPDWLETPLRTG